MSTPAQIPPHPLRRPLQVKEPEGPTRPRSIPIFFKNNQTASSLVQIAQCLFLRIILRIIATEYFFCQTTSSLVQIVDN